MTAHNFSKLEAPLLHSVVDCQIWGLHGTGEEALDRLRKECALQQLGLELSRNWVNVLVPAIVVLLQSCQHASVQAEKAISGKEHLHAASSSYITDPSSKAG